MAVVVTREQIQERGYSPSFGAGRLSVWTQGDTGKRILWDEDTGRLLDMDVLSHSPEEMALLVVETLITLRELISDGLVANAWRPGRRDAAIAAIARIRNATRETVLPTQNKRAP